MADFDIDADQLEAFGRQLAGVGVELADLEPPNEQAGRLVLANSTPPRLTGQLAATTRADATRDGVTFASTARYWTFVHFGAPRRHIVARPFFTEALQASTDELLAIYAEHASNKLAGLD